MHSSSSCRSRSTVSVMAAIFIVGLVLSLALALVACGDSTSIVGKWVDADGVVAEFTSDGKIVSDDMMGMDIQYVTKDGKLTLIFMGQEITGEYTIKGDTLTLIDPETGEPDTLTRVK